MKTLTVTEVAVDFSAVMDRVKADQEGILVIRNNKPIVRLVPKPTERNALEILGGLCQTLDDETANALTSVIDAAKKVKRETPGELRHPWVS